MVKMSSKCFDEVWERNFDNNGGGACGKGAPLNGCISKEIYLDKKEGTSFSILWFSPFFYVPWFSVGTPHLVVAPYGLIARPYHPQGSRTCSLLPHVYSSHRSWSKTRSTDSCRRGASSLIPLVGGASHILKIYDRLQYMYIIVGRLTILSLIWRERIGSSHLCRLCADI